MWMTTLGEGNVKTFMLLMAIFFGLMAAKNAVIDRDATDALILTGSTIGCLVSSIYWKRGVRR